MRKTISIFDAVVESVRTAKNSEIGIICDLIQCASIPKKYVDMIGVALLERYTEGGFPSQQMYEETLDNLESRKAKQAA